MKKASTAARFRVVVHGMSHFSRKLPGLLGCEEWDVRHHAWSGLRGLPGAVRDLRRCDLLYLWGGTPRMGNFLRLARSVGVKRVVMLWAGTDALLARLSAGARDIDPWIAKQIHWAVSPWIADEVRSLGIPCEYVQASFVSEAERIAPLPAKFSVLLYLPNTTPNVLWLYHWDEVLKVARQLPSVQFNVCGRKQSSDFSLPPNVDSVRWVRDLVPLLCETTVLWRPVRHDGLSFMVLEALTQGRHVIYSYPLPGCIQAKDGEAACVELTRLSVLHESGGLSLNEEGIHAMKGEYSAEVVRERLQGRWREIIAKPAAAASRQARRRRDRKETAGITMPVLRRTERVKRQVLVHGLPYFGKMMAEYMTGDGWDFRFYPDEGAGNFARMAHDLVWCDIIYQIGGRLSLGKFLALAKFLGKDKIVVEWCGSDVLTAQGELAKGKTDPWVAKHIHHWADSESIATEIRVMGLDCEAVIPLPTVSIPEQAIPLPKDFGVLCYVPGTNRGELYGLDLILEVARLMPGIRFELVGLNQGTIADPSANLGIHRRLPLLEFYRRAVVVWRPARHDGLSSMVLEALGYGRHVLWSYPFPGCTHVTSAEEARREIARLHELHKRGHLEVNSVGVQLVAREYAPSLVKRKILGRLEHILEPGRLGSATSFEALP